MGETLFQNFVDQILLIRADMEKIMRSFEDGPPMDIDVLYLLRMTDHRLRNIENDLHLLKKHAHLFDPP
jgi:hypothetical protein